MTVFLALLALTAQDGSAPARNFFDRATAGWNGGAALRIECAVSPEGINVRREFVLTLKRPNLARVEQSVMGIPAMTCVFDGENGWMHLKAVNRYVKFRSDELERLVGWGGWAALLYLHPRTVDEILSDGQTRMTEEKVAKETFRVAEIAPSGGDAFFRLWADASGILRRMQVRPREGGSGSSQTMEYTKIQSIPDPPAGTFSFTPPEGAQEMPPETPR